MVNAPVVARERGMAVDETRQSQRGAYETYIRLTVRTENLMRSVAGTVFSDGKPRIIQIKGIDLEASFAPRMLYITNEDKPGFIGRLGTFSGRSASIRVVQSRPISRADADLLIEVDGPIDGR
jgi:D-3-phosphoglycerate dehydrogenase